MIKRLQRRMTLLVIIVLILISAGTVVAIYFVNTNNIITQVESTLDTLEENRGVLPSMPEGTDAPPNGTDAPPEIPEEGQDGDDLSSPPPKPDGEDDPGKNGPNGPRGNERGMTREEVASLSNYYTMTLDSDGQILSWESDHSDLYSEEALQLFADQVMDTGESRGQIGTQYYRLLTSDDGKMLIVLDARLELMAGRSVLVTTIIVAAASCVLLSVGAWFLIRKMIRPVEEAFVKQQQFVWDASHELKTPLAVISANADVLQSEIGENEYLGYIQSEVRRTDGLVKNLLTLARMDRGTVNRDLTEVDLSEAVLGVLLPFESTVFEAGKTLESDIQEHVKCNGNEAMLQQLTVILLSNALKYSDEHGIIRVKLNKKSRSAELRVENTGEGIAPADLERIFDRFYRADASRNSETGGEGLGLAIAKSIVEIHHGKITAESVPGESATFIVHLPG